MKNDLLSIINDQFKTMESKVLEHLNLEIKKKIEEKIDEIKKPQEVQKREFFPKF